MSTKEAPVFAVVGHPNKGKSSIVATLAQDETVAVSPVPGTTTRCRHYPMRIDGRLLYTLVDTPGFQRARSALAWLQERQSDAASRMQLVREFVETHRGSGRFTDECELLTPIVDGAGILYVVDGSRPYGAEYEAEMEILRWTGRPSMALINMIGEDEYVEDWRRALDQFFKVVRVFDAFVEPFYRHIELLQAFGELRDEWRAPLSDAIAHLQEDRTRRRHQAAGAIARMLILMLTRQQSQPLPEGADEAALKQSLYARLLDGLRALEKETRSQVESLYHYDTLQREESVLHVIESDLFAESSWDLFGLNRRQLVTAGMVGGAAAGGGVDLALGGASLLLGTVVGGALGAMTALVGHPHLARFKLGGERVGQRIAQVGPINNPNFPYVVLARALYHHTQLTARTHAQRDTLVLKERMERFSAAHWPRDARQQLARLAGRAQSAGESSALSAALTRLVDELLAHYNGV